MSPHTNKAGKPNKPTSRWKFAVVGLLVVVLAFVIVGRREVDDDALARALAGTWTAVDPSDGSLHRRNLPVSHEQLVIGADGELTHVVELASNPGNPEYDLWGWKVRKGRLYARFQGEDASGQWLPGIAFAVSNDTLSMRIKGHPPKKWVRR